jgi:hypothetical protein
MTCEVSFDLIRHTRSTRFSETGPSSMRTDRLDETGQRRLRAAVSPHRTSEPRPGFSNYTVLAGAPLRNRTVDLLLTMHASFVWRCLVMSGYRRPEGSWRLATSRCVCLRLGALSLDLSLAASVRGGGNSVSDESGGAYIEVAVFCAGPIETRNATCENLPRRRHVVLISRLRRDRVATTITPHGIPLYIPRRDCLVALLLSFTTCHDRCNEAHRVVRGSHLPRAVLSRRGSRNGVTVAMASSSVRATGRRERPASARYPDSQSPRSGTAKRPGNCRPRRWASERRAVSCISASADAARTIATRSTRSL